MLLCRKNEESYQKKTFEFYSSQITVVSNIFKQTKMYIDNVSVVEKNVTF